MTGEGVFVVDTGVLAALVVEHDPRRGFARRWLAEAEGEIIASSQAFANLASHLARHGVSPKMVDRSLAMIKEWVKPEPMTDEIMAEATMIAREKRLRSSDALVVAIAARNKARLVTLNPRRAAQTKGAAVEVTCLTPAHWRP